MLVHPIRTNLSLCIIFSVFALLNLRLHRRVKLLVLASSLLEFRVLVISCHVAAAPYSSLLPYHHRCHIPPLLPYTTTAAISYHNISTTNPSSFHIRFVLEIHLGFGFVFPCLRRSRKRKKFRQVKIFFPYPTFGLF